MKNDSIESLVTKAADLAANAAIEWLAAHGYRLDTVSKVRLSEACRKHVDAALLPALEDVRSAYAANMSRFAVATFGLSMVNAGIAAAREAVAS